MNTHRRQVPTNTHAQRQTSHINKKTEKQTSCREEFTRINKAPER